MFNFVYRTVNDNKPFVFIQPHCCFVFMIFHPIDMGIVNASAFSNVIHYQHVMVIRLNHNLFKWLILRET